MPFGDQPIQHKIMVIILSIIITVTVLTHLAFFGFGFFAFRSATLRQVSAIGKVIAANCTAAMAFDNRGDAQETLGALKAENQIVAGVLYDNRGKLFARFPEGMREDSLPTHLGKGYRFEGLSLVGFQPVIQGHRRLGTLYLKFDAGSRLSEWIFNSLAIGFSIVVVSLGVAYFMSRRLQRQITHPILALAGAAKDVSDRGDFSIRAPKLSRDEIGLLTDSFNQMLERIRILNSTLEQRVIERTAQLETVNKELEAFSYSVSHDLRAPLRHISGFVQMLKRESHSALSEKGQRYLEVIAASAQRMGMLIDDLLVFSRMGRSEMHRTNLRMDELVAESIREMAVDLEGRRIAWEIGSLGEVNGDRTLLKQVWINLLSNAVKYTRHRDEAVIKVTGRDNGQCEMIYSVQDNGAGFDMQYVGKLFGVFQRLHLAEEFEGTGIGLANVQRIVTRHSGRVWAEGKLDHGATFYFSIPKQPKKET